MNFTINIPYRAKYTSKELNKRFATVFGGNCIIDGLKIVPVAGTANFTVSPGKAIVDGAEITITDTNTLTLSAIGKIFVVITYAHEASLVTLSTSPTEPVEENKLAIATITLTGNISNPTFEVVEKEKVPGISSSGATGGKVSINSTVATENILMNSDRITCSGLSAGLTETRLSDGTTKVASTQDGTFSLYDEDLIGDIDIGDKVPISMRVKGTKRGSANGTVIATVEGNASAETIVPTDKFADVKVLCECKQKLASKWTNSVDMTTNVENGSSIAVDYSTSNSSNSRHILNITNNFVNCSTIVNDKIHLFLSAKSGYSSRPPIIHYSYKLTTRDLLVESPMSINIKTTETECVNNKIYILGGVAVNDASADVVVAEVKEYNLDTKTITPKANMSGAKFAFGLSVVNANIYIFGGYNNVSNMSTVEMYNTNSDTWSAKTPIPIATRFSSAVTIGEKIYVTGGYTNTYILDNNEYDTVSNTWTVKAPVTITGKLKSVVVGGKIYALESQSNTNIAVEEYSPATNTWSEKRSLPIDSNTSISSIESSGSRIHMISSILGTEGYMGPFKEHIIDTYDIVTNMWNVIDTSGVNEKSIFVAGGKISTTFNNKIKKFNTATSAWTDAGTTTKNRTKPCLARFNDKLFVIGGNDGSTSSKAVECFDISTGVVEALPDAPVAFEGAASGIMGETMYLFGGKGREYLTRTFSPSTKTWGSTDISTINFKVCDSNYIQIGTTIFFCCGKDGDILHNRNVSYDFSSSSQTILSSPKQAFTDAIVVNIKNKIYFIGGKTSSGTMTEIPVYDITKDNWSYIKTMPTQRHSPYGGLIGDKVYVAGGYTSNNTFSPKNEALSVNGNKLIEFTTKNLSELQIKNIFVGKGDIVGNWTPAQEDKKDKDIITFNGAVIHSSNWIADSATGLKRAEIHFTNISATDTVNVNFGISEQAKVQGVKSATESFDGYVRLYADPAATPTQDVTCDITIIKGR
ncbi:MAG: hypothetical protein RR420_00670 [Anaerovoracaceae bacterium]